ncbi:MAG: leucine-rich repeat domain-containing protein [Firmicutes bacterium]|nr:leucine-rich repeat domain-containing protein [Bacillota bacterium]
MKNLFKNKKFIISSAITVALLVALIVAIVVMSLAYWIAAPTVEERTELRVRDFDASFPEQVYHALDFNGNVIMAENPNPSDIFSYALIGYLGLAPALVIPEQYTAVINGTAVTRNVSRVLSPVNGGKMYKLPQGLQGTDYARGVPFNPPNASIALTGNFVVKELVVSKFVLEISNGVFANMLNLESVELRAGTNPNEPLGVLYIGNFAFGGCINLSKLIINRTLDSHANAWLGAGVSP